MSDAIVTIVGTGLIGTSMGMSLKSLEDAPQVIGHDKEPEHTRQAMKMGAMDKIEWNLIAACEVADLIVLALPAAQIKPTLEALVREDALKEDVVITDTAPSKGNIMAMADEILPETVHYVGGNPIVSSPYRGPAHARADLFQNALYCLTPASAVTPDAIRLLEQLIYLIGATVFYLDPTEHDGLMTAVNGLPALLSVSLVNTLTKAPSWVEMRKLASRQFSDATAGATGDPDSLAQDFIANKTSLLHWIDAQVTSLTQLRATIDAEDAETLAETIDSAVITRQEWQSAFEQNRLSNLLPEESMEEKEGFLKKFLGIGRRRK